MISTVDLGFGKGYHDKEGITKATISENATINAEVEGDLNRDTNNVQIITKDESDQIDADLSIDTDIVSEQYWNNVYNTGENLQELNDNFSDATGIDIADGISDGYNFVADVFTEEKPAPSPTLKALLDGANSEKLQLSDETQLACLGLCVGAIIVSGIILNEILDQSDSEIAENAKELLLWVPLVGTGAALDNAGHAIADGDYVGAVGDTAEAILNSTGSGLIVKGVKKVGTKIVGKKLVGHVVERQALRNVSKKSVRNALKNPLKTTAVKYDKLGRPSIKVIGKKATVVVNPNTGKIITTWPTSSKLLRKLIK